jgi:hypothetical protein
VPSVFLNLKLKKSILSVTSHINLKLIVLQYTSIVYSNKELLHLKFANNILSQDFTIYIKQQFQLSTAQCKI